MNILGINYLGHDAAASLLVDGELVAAIEEERFHRYRKHFGGFPEQAMRYCLDTAGLNMSQVEHLAYYISPTALLNAKGWVEAFRPWYSIRGKLIYLSRLLYLYHCATLRGRVRKHFPDFNPDARIHYVAHHDAHMASAFFPSAFEEADIISIDGIGEWESTVIGEGRGNCITRTSSIYFPNSLGYLYSAVTRHLGFKVNNDEYKVMGLSGYGDPSRYRALFKRILQFRSDGSFVLDPRYFSLGVGWGQVSSRFIEESALTERMPESELLQEHMDMSAAIQEVAEEAGLHLARHLQKKTGRRHLCMAGGVALNCLMNAKILQETDYQDIFIQPAAYDASGSLGSALWTQHQILGHPRSFTMRHAYYGYESNEEEIRSALERYKDRITFHRSENVCAETAGIIAEQNIVGWFQGRMEWGPRALGNRSILADPRQRKMMDIVNDRVKHREDFRPFAPSCKIESYQDYFELQIPSAYMLLICNVKKAMRERIQAVTHTDGTARYHTVERTANPRYWELLDEFEKISGVPVLLNTSFNVRGETIVMTPDDALRCFLGTGIDILVLGDWIVHKGTTES